jgi:hypothetical protein
MNWINVKAAEISQNSSSPGRVLHNFPQWNDANPNHPFIDLTEKNGWPEPNPRLRNERYEDALVILPTGSSFDGGYFVRRTAVQDPLFWDQPITDEWLRDLREQLGK